MERRDFLKTGLLATAASTSVGAAFWRRAYAAPAEPAPGPYGPLGEADANGIRLPAGFSSRIVAVSGEVVAGTSYLWHPYPDGGATFATQDGGWIYVSNSEVPGLGGAGSLRFDAAGSIVGAARILAGTTSNCAGGPTPWGTWLSCEEYESGLVWECDPTGVQPAIPHLAMGSFQHEAAAVDPIGQHVYLTEDRTDSNFYRFTPAEYPNLSSGLLEAMIVDEAMNVTWGVVADPNPLPTVNSTRNQVADAKTFNGGEGCWFDGPSRTVYFTTKGDNKVWAHHVDEQTLEVIHDRAATPTSPLRGVDNVTVSRSGDILVAEDGGDMEIVLITPGPARTVSSLVQVMHSGSEIAGPAFDPSGTRLYFSSQRANRLGLTYEVSGPFRATA